MALAILYRKLKHNVLGVVSAVLLGAGLSSCTTLSPALVKALAEDDASFCATADVRGGVGSVVAPSGGYGQSTVSFCRARKDGATITLGADGSISIQHE